MKNIDRTDEVAMAEIQCPACGEIAGRDARGCDACGQEQLPARRAATLVFELGSLVLALVLVVAVCLAIDYLAGV